MDAVSKLFGLVTQIININGALRAQVSGLSTQVADLQKGNTDLSAQLTAAKAAVVALPPVDPTAVPASALQPSIDALTATLTPPA
jgi:hypothetical protein